MARLGPLNVTRRDVMVAGGAGMVAAGVAAPGSALTLGGGTVDGEAARYKATLGYWQGSDGIADLGKIAELRSGTTIKRTEADETSADPFVCADIVPAEALGTGDRELPGRPIRFGAHGFVGLDEGRQPDLPWFDLRAHFKPYHEHCCIVWGHETDPVCGCRPASALTVPIAPAAGLTLSLDFKTHEQMIHLASGSDVGAAKLRRGIYFLAWGRQDAPSWWRYRIETRARDAQAKPAITEFRIVDRIWNKPARNLDIAMISIDAA